METDDLRRKLDFDPNRETDEDDDDFEELELDCYMTERAEVQDLVDLFAMDELSQDNPARRAMVEKAVRDGHCSLVSNNAGQILAFGIFDYSYSRKQGFIHLIHVHVDHRGQGVGADMLMGFESTCSTQHIYCAVPRSNLAAQELVRSVGYVQAKKVPQRGNPKDPETVYVKDIWAPEPYLPLETVQ